MKPAARFAAAFATMAGAALAHPEGAPWGAADPDGAQSCATCHFDFDAERDAAAVTLAGLPAVAIAGETYELVLNFAPAGAEIAGFMLTVSEGVFHDDGDGVEANEQDVRSTAPAPALEGASWLVTWTAPETHSKEGGGEIFFYAAVNGANDDMSAFGDRVYFRTFSVNLAD